MEKTNKQISPKTWLSDLLAGSLMRFDLLKFNLGPLLAVVTTYSLFATVICIPLLSRAAQTIIALSGLENLTAENAGAFLTNPVTVIGLLILLIFVLFIAMLDLGASIYTFDCARQKVHVSVRSIFLFSIKNAARMFLPKNLPIFLVVLVLVPFVGLTMSTSIFSAITIPAALSSYVRSNSVILIVSLIALIACFVLSLRWMYALHFFTIEGLDCAAAISKSNQLKRSKRIQNLISMLIIQGILSALTKILSVGGTVAVSSSINLVGVKTLIGALIVSTILVAFFLAIAFLSLVSAPIGALKISGKFYQLKESSNEEIIGVACEEARVAKKSKWIDRIIGVAIIVIAIVFMAIYANQVALGNIANALDNSKQPEVIAFENGGLKANANTLASLEALSDVGADGALVNIQISKDGIALLATSPDLAVVSGIQGNCWDLTYDEIYASSLALKKSEDAAIPKLSDAIKRARDNEIKLIVDISSASYNSNAIEIVMNEIKHSDAISFCEIASSSYSDLERVKAIAPEVKTVFIAGVSSNDYAILANANAVALEGSLLSQDNVTAIHDSGHEAYAWEVSTATKIDAAIRAKVDALVSSSVTTAIDEANRFGYNKLEYTFYSRLSSQDNG